ncbi:glycosyl transferase [Aeromonas sobria]|uniref:glycosyltransferase n=1 Tax=Aeromonas sobria TaxID=646 RepID=UPI00111A7855|nr:glycosyltransferase [Aeromonas sobria]TNJ21950.1 glycosyl transferase [Aeromonas sobria]
MTHVNIEERKKKILVLLAAHEGQNYLNEQILSLLNQVNVDIKIVISVDYSSDESFNICHGLSLAYPCITVLPYGERFLGAGKNFYRLIKDVDFGEFEYIAFSDQDDIWPDNKLSNAIEALNQFDCYSANVTAFWEDGCEILIDKAQKQRKWDFLFEAAGPGCTYVLRQEVAVRFKTWLLEYYENVREDIALHDWLIYAFARCRGYHWFIDVESMMRYRQHANNQVGTNNSFKAAKKRLKLISNKWYRQQVVNIATYLDLRNTPIFFNGLNNGYIGNLYLLLHIGQLRRRFRDRLALAFFLLFNIF